jgi:hypothetical protein
MTSRK